MTDMTLHGGTVTGLATQTLIGGQPAARKGDPHLCPVHGPGLITGSCSNVYIEGKLAARMLDDCGCALTGVAGKGAPPTKRPADIYPGGPFTAPSEVGSTDSKNRTSKQRLEVDGYHGLHAEWERVDSDGDGTRDTARAEAGVGRVKGEFETPEWGGFKIRGKGEGDFVHGRAEARASSGDMETGTDGFGGGAGAVAEADGVKGKGEVEVCTPLGNAKWDGEGIFGNAGVEISGQLGDDGTDIGINARAKAGGGVAGVKGSPPGLPDIEIKLPFTGISATSDTDVGYTYGGFGASGEAGIYYSRKDGRFHIKGAGAIQGLSVDIDFSIGPFTEPTDSPGGAGAGRPPEGIPNKIATGFPLVLIGD